MAASASESDSLTGQPTPGQARYAFIHCSFEGGSPFSVTGKVLQKASQSCMDAGAVGNDALHKRKKESIKLSC